MATITWIGSNGNKHIFSKPKDLAKNFFNNLVTIHLDYHSSNFDAETLKIEGSGTNKVKIRWYEHSVFEWLEETFILDMDNNGIYA